MAREVKNGSNCSGSDGATSRVLTLSNSDLTESEQVIVDRQVLIPNVDYTASHLSANSTITFTIPIYNAMQIVVSYVSPPTSVTYTPSTVAGTNYTTVSKVEQALNLPIGSFTSETTPTADRVKEIINEMEWEIDNATKTAFRERAVFEEMHDFTTIYREGAGVAVHLNHRPLRAFDSTKGDKIEVYEGTNTYTDYLTSKTEGRNADYWVDTKRGIIWFKQTFAITQDVLIRVTYRYGDLFKTQLNGSILSGATSITVDSVTGAQPTGVIRIDNEDIYYGSIDVSTKTFGNLGKGYANTTSASHANDAVVTQIPLDIQSLCTKMVVVELVENNDTSGIIASNPDALRVKEKIEEFKKEIDDRLSRYKGYRYMGI